MKGYTTQLLCHVVGEVYYVYRHQWHISVQYFCYLVGQLTNSPVATRPSLVVQSPSTSWPEEIMRVSLSTSLLSVSFGLKCVVHLASQDCICHHMGVDLWNVLISFLRNTLFPLRLYVDGKIDPRQNSPYNFT